MYEGDGLRIRKATQEDTRAIVELWKELMGFHKERDRHFTRSADGHKRFAEFVSGRIAHKASSILVAEQQDEIIGYCLATISKYPPVYEHQEYGAIFDLAVHAIALPQQIGRRRVSVGDFGDEHVDSIVIHPFISSAK